MWYAIQVTTGQEESTAQLISGRVPDELLEEVFYPRYEVLRKVRGERVVAVKPLIPGYLIASTRQPSLLQERLRALPVFARVLCTDGVPTPLEPEEARIIGAFTQPGMRVVPMSRAVKEGERVRVLDGPLVGQEVLITNVDRHKCQASIEMDFCGRRVSTRLGLVVFNEVEDALPPAKLSELALMGAEG